MAKFKMLNDEAVKVVDKLAAKVTTVTNMKDEELQKIAEAIKGTENLAKREIAEVAHALASVKEVVAGEITKRGIKSKVDNQISLFDNSNKLEAK